MTLITWGFGWRIFGALTSRLAEGGRLMTLSGPVASGKTRLLDMLARFAIADDLSVLHARCSPADRMTQLNVPAQLLFAYRTPTEESIADDAAELIRIATDGNRPALVLVDDLRYADDDSVHFLDGLVARIADEPLLLVLADRQPTVRDYVDRIEDSAARLLSRHISLTALSLTETREIAAQEFGLQLEPDAAARIHAMARGNLRLVRAVLEDTIVAGQVGTPVTGSAYRLAVLDGLRTVTPEAREVAMAVAVLGSGSDQATLAGSSGLDRTAVAAALAELELSGMLDGDRLIPAARQAVLSDMQQARLEAYRRHGSCGKRLAIQILAAPPTAVGVRPGDSTATLAVPGAGYEGLHEVRATIRMLDLKIGRMDGTNEADDLAAAQLLTCCEFPGLLRDFLARHPQRRCAGSPRYQAAWALASSMVEHGANPDPDQQAADALARCPRTDEAMPSLVAAIMALMHQQHWERARAWCERLLTEEREQSAAWQAHVLTARAEARLRLGDTAGAGSDAGLALDLLPAWRWGLRVGWPLSILVMVDSLAGAHDRAAHHLKTPTPALMQETRHGVSYRYTRGQHYLATGEYRLALADFLNCGRVTRRWQVDLSAYYPWQAAAAATYQAIGDYSEAVVLIDEYRRALKLRGRSIADREVAFDLLSQATDTATLTKAITTIQHSEPALARLAGVARYKIHDRYSGYLAKLSRSEQRVAMLAAKGLSNQHIAKELSLTVSTVEQHLTRTYRKLDVSGRNELRAMLG